MCARARVCVFGRTRIIFNFVVKVQKEIIVDISENTLLNEKTVMDGWICYILTFDPAQNTIPR